MPQQVVDTTDVVGGVEVTTTSLLVPGGTLYTSVAHSLAIPDISVSSVLQAAALVPQRRFLPLTYAKADTGVGLTATPTGGAMGISRTAGSVMKLLGEATSASGVTDKALFDVVLPDSYVAAADIPVIVRTTTTGTGVQTAATTTMTVAAYYESAGTETALTVSAAKRWR